MKMNRDFGMGFPVNAPCEPTEQQPLNERASLIEERCHNVFRLADAVFCELYGPTPSPCDEAGNKPIHSLEETINQIGYKLSYVEDCLSETLKRLRG
jgi:hypothetical protein